MRVLEVCVGAGGMALGLERAGFRPVALVEWWADACATLKANRPAWPVVCADLRTFDASRLDGRVDLVAGGPPCQPYSVMGRHLGPDDERDMIGEMLRIVGECRPRAVLVENVPGIMGPRFASWRREIAARVDAAGLVPMGWRVVDAVDHGVPQRRRRAFFVAVEPPAAEIFSWPTATARPGTVGEVLLDEMAASGWEGARAWAARADAWAPTLVGGSDRHLVGADLGRSRHLWVRIGVDPSGVADAPPGPGHDGPVRLTLRMLATLQGFPPDWRMVGDRVSRFRQIANACPPPLAEAVARAVADALEGRIPGVHQQRLVQL